MHRYIGIEKIMNRFGKPVVKKGSNEFQRILIRFDYRNQTVHPETGLKMGNIPICEDLANEFIDVEEVKKNAIKVFKFLEKHFELLNIYFQDISLSFTADGKRMYGEISQDCGRYKNLSKKEIPDLDTDIWRSGGSGALLLAQYKKLSGFVIEHVSRLYLQEQKARDEQKIK